MSNIVDPAQSVKDITDLCVQYFRAGCPGHCIRHRGSCSFNAFSNSSIFGQDVLDIVSDIVNPAASILHLTFYLDLCIVQQLQYFRAGCQDIVSDIVDPATSILHLTFYLALCIVQPDLIP